MNLALYRKPCICDNSKSVGLSELKGCVILFLQSLLPFNFGKIGMETV